MGNLEENKEETKEEVSLATSTDNKIEANYKQRGVKASLVSGDPKTKSKKKGKAQTSNFCCF